MMLSSFDAPLRDLYSLSWQAASMGDQNYMDMTGKHEDPWIS